MKHDYHTIATPPAPPQTAVGQPNREAASIWMAAVIAPFVQNIGGGLGVLVLGVAVDLIGYWVGWWAALDAGAKIAGILALIVFGVMMIVRAFRDEWQMVIAAWGSRQDLATRQALRAEIERLAAEIEHLQSEGAIAHRWSIREAAELLIAAYYHSPDIDQESRAKLLTRSASMARGMTRPAWEQGVKILRDAGILRQGELLVPSEEAAFAAVARYHAESRTWRRTADGDLAKT